jgi:hypothetical protein
VSKSLKSLSSPNQHSTIKGLLYTRRDIGRRFQITIPTRVIGISGFIYILKYNTSTIRVWVRRITSIVVHARVDAVFKTVDVHGHKVPAVEISIAVEGESATEYCVRAEDSGAIACWSEAWTRGRLGGG